MDENPSVGVRIVRGIGDFVALVVPLGVLKENGDFSGWGGFVGVDDSHLNVLLVGLQDYYNWKTIKCK